MDAFRLIRTIADLNNFIQTLLALQNIQQNQKWQEGGCVEKINKELTSKGCRCLANQMQ